MNTTNEYYEYYYNYWIEIDEYYHYYKYYSLITYIHTYLLTYFLRILRILLLRILLGKASVKQQYERIEGLDIAYVNIGGDDITRYCVVQSQFGLDIACMS